MKITRGKIPGAKKVVVYGPEGIGKSTFASKFPDPVFIDTEGSTRSMDVARLPRPTSWEMLLEEIDYVKNNPQVCRTLVIDTVDWAEQLCIEFICAKHQKNGIESFGYGTGYVYTREEFGRFLNQLEDVIESGVHVVLTAHAQMRKFEQPDEMGAYDRYELKLGKKTASQTAPLVKEWADMLLFANYKTYSIAVDDKGKKHKAQGGKRVMYTQHHPCWDAKNRYGLEDEIAFDYAEIAHILEDAQKAPRRTEQQEKATSEILNAAPEAKRQQKAELDPVLDVPDGVPEQMEFDTGSDQKISVKESVPIPKKPEADVSKSEIFHLKDYIPKALRDLMYPNLVSEEELMEAVYQRGYYPRGMPFQNLEQEFVEGCLIAGWPKVLSVVKEIRSSYEIPFEK